MNRASCLHLAAGPLTASIALRGAELRSLRHDQRELIWSGDAQWWPYSAPLLFPVIGRLENGQYTHEGRVFSMPAHGLARTASFTVLSATASSAEFSLRASPETLDLYPFDFELKVTFELTAQHLSQQVQVINHGIRPMLASVGFHPGFRWPMDPTDRQGHSVRFEQFENGKAFRVDGGGHLVQRESPLPLQDATLFLEDRLFADGAIVFNPVRSTRLQYLGPQGPVMEMEWTGCDQLGLWTLPGAPFVCFEPWRGHPPPVDSPESLSEKPGVFALPPGQSTSVGMTILPGSRCAGPAGR